MTAQAIPAPTRPPFWRNVRVLRVLGQVVFVLAVAFVLRELYLNMKFGFQRQGIALDFEFLRQRAGFDLAEGIAFSPNSSFTRAIQVGVVNTIRVAGIGIVLASLLGLVMGVARLSTNWLVRNVARAYVEAFRNTPVLIQIIFWYFAVILTLPLVQGEGAGGIAFLSNRGAAIPWLRGRPDTGQWVLWLLGGMALAAVLWVWRTRRNERTGTPHHRVLWGLGAFLAVAAIGYVATGNPLELDVPRAGDFGYSGGLQFSGEFAAILLGLVFYTGAFIAEIIRGSILAVDKGQKEAAMAMGLSPAQQLRLVVLPQALRVALPPLNSQYLNLTKNSSLAAAIAYPDLANVASTIINQAGRPFQILIIVVTSYLILSLFISTIMNILNRTVALRGTHR